MSRGTLIKKAQVLQGLGMISPAHMILRASWVMAANYRRPLAKSMRSTVSSSGFSSLDRLHYFCFCNSMQAFLLYLLKEPDRALLSSLLPFFPRSRPRRVTSTHGSAVCDVPFAIVQRAGLYCAMGDRTPRCPSALPYDKPSTGQIGFAFAHDAATTIFFLSFYSSSVVQLAAWMAPSTWRSWADI